MTRTRLGSLAAALVGVALLATPAAAQSSTTAGLINGLNENLLYVAIPITILVEVILIYTVLKFKDSDDPKPTKENRRLEITWTVATAIVLLFVGAASYGVLADPSVTYTGGTDDIEPAEGDVHVETVAYQWNWRMNYETSNITELTAGDLDTEAIPQAEGLEGPVIVVPQGQELFFTVTSDDVIHALHVPDLGLKQDAIPGQENTIKTTAQETGVYQGYCAEYCGVAHSNMYFNVVVVDQDTYDDFVDRQTDGEGDA
ncbi:cytochrome c oxidase subunit II [Halobaculum sp. CBA1158]|uniref:cytochrome c oxidase subunit II n=1 Tax=Halobaculum sp. CBA1158 TaxID=2904243 RepID=UPI001F438F40|nr:cytochrome c oxidase subunit II [Halobaculum sp. CBA1158]UIO99491.1 cytochrome c oxidase subunit II [Halobaculum sp. CBA1158]